MKFVSPALLILFASAFFGVWFVDRSRRYLLVSGTGFVLFGVSILCQMTILPPNTGINVLVTGAMYVGGALSFSAGILMRSGLRLPRVAPAIWSTIIMGLLAYFFYGERNLLARVYALNFGIGFIFLHAVWYARSLARGKKVDSVLFWIFLLFAVHFFPRTALTTGSLQALTSNSALADANAYVESPFWMWVQFSSMVLGVGMGIGLLTVTGTDMIIGLRRERDSDVLTGLFNRRGLQNRIPAIVAKSQSDEVSIIVCDIDYFKKINDTYGHATGDAVLVHVANVISKSTGSDMCAARIGGEEFLIVMCGPVDQAYEHAERLRQTIQTMRLDDLSLVRSVTCSFGVAPYQRGEDFWRAVSRADTVLYAAKKAGRNQTFAEGIQVPVVA